MIAALDAVPALVTQAAQRTERFERGVVGFRLHRVFDVHAGPYKRHDEMELAGIYQDGRVLKIRVLYQRVGGRETDEATKTQTVSQYEHPKPQDVFARPFDPQHVSEYSYTAPQGSTVHFHALICDAAHGDGTFSLDPDADVLSVQYAPCVLPQYTRSATIEIQRSAVLPGYWSAPREVQEYRGHYAIFSGGATVLVEQSGFVRFPNAAAALEALAENHI